MREPKQLIEECKKHLRDTEQYKHEYKKDIRKLITALEKQLAISGVVGQSEQFKCGMLLSKSGKRCEKQCVECELTYRNYSI